MCNVLQGVRNKIVTILIASDNLECLTLVVTNCDLFKSKINVIYKVLI